MFISFNYLTLPLTHFNRFKVVKGRERFTKYTYILFPVGLKTKEDS